jgi:hypothetical protein
MTRQYGKGEKKDLEDALRIGGVFPFYARKGGDEDANLGKHLVFLLSENTA